MSKLSSSLTFGAVSGPMRCFCALVALAGISMPCFGLRAEPPPDPPLVASTPDHSAWTMDVEWNKPRPKHAPDPSQEASYSRITDIYSRLVQVKVEKAGKDWHREKLFENQKREKCVGFIKGALSSKCAIFSRIRLRLCRSTTPPRRQRAPSARISPILIRHGRRCS